MGPALSAIITLNYFYTKNDLKNFIKSYSTKEITSTAWALAFSPLLYFVIAIGFSGLITGQWFNLSEFFLKNRLLTPATLLAWVLPPLAYGIFEEAGWRGFAIPVLQTRYTALSASTILAVFWVGWHIPTFFYRYQMEGAMWIGFILGIYAGALYLTHLYNFTRGSLMVVTIWHITWNLVAMIGKEGMLPAVMSTLIMALAVFVVLRYKARNLAPSPKATLPRPFNKYLP